MKYLSLFSGIGAFEKSLDNLKIPYELVGFSEIDKYAVKSYCAIHSIDESLNLGDITKIDEKALSKDIDLITYGFPCQDISLAGKQQGLFNDDGTLTRSGLFFDALRIITHTHTKVAIAENVKNLTSKKFSGQFKIVLDSLEEAGYNNYWAVLNLKDFGIPQNRERVFIVSIRKDIDTGNFKFPEGFPLKLRLKDMLDEAVEEKFYLSDKMKDYLSTITEKNKARGNGNVYKASDVDGTAKAITTKEGSRVKDNFIEEPVVKQLGNCCPTKTRENPNQGRIYDKDGISPCLNQMEGGNRQPFVEEEPKIIREEPLERVGWHNYAKEVLSTGGLCRTLSTQSNNLATKIKETASSRIRKLTPKECFRLMGFDDVDFEKAETANSNTQLYKQAGNSIGVPVCEYIIKALFDCGALENERGVKEMELKIYSPTEEGFIQAIEWNHEEIKKGITEKVKHYTNLVYSEDQIRAAKVDRAQLNKFVQALETKRKEIKKQCLAPYEEFEIKLKEIIAIVNEPIQMIDSQIKADEERKREDKMEEILRCWNELCVFKWLHIEQVFNDKWLNASVTIKSVRNEIVEKMEQISADLATLSNLPEFSFEATDVYKQSLDINKAIQEGKRLADLQKRKAETEAKGAVNASIRQFNEPQKDWIAFKAQLSTEDAVALREFFKSRNIKYEAI